MRKLVAYFSASGVTRKRAEELGSAINADLYEIIPESPYTDNDLDWHNRQSRSSVEMQNPSSRPMIAGEKIDLASYGRVYIGFPIWWGVAPRIINTFIESHSFEGKEIVVFATSGGSGIRTAVEDIKGKYPQLNIIGSALLSRRVSADII
ncbi:MAG: flavodoxin [Spirochaetes bacterium]|uniref:Flavodoxin n=1 Tax=Candidatus Ornithospirochaeta stercoripullorum TaxID=2840899 RepID=A0A9D9E1Q6_9SPIO|nr:flavodoxin [Candidatus Ornithospirochaeta stercoripullorum]